MELGISARMIGAARCSEAARLAILCSRLWLAPTPSFGTDLSVTAPSPGHRSDQVLVQPKPGVNQAQLARFHTVQKTLVRQWKTMGGLEVLAVPASATVSGLIAECQQSGLFQLVEPDFLVRTTATVPNDPKYLDGTLWALNQIDAPDGWDVLTSADRIIVAVLDTGVRYTHEDLAANMWVNPTDRTHGLDALAGTSDPSDDSGHGTMVAGILGAVGNNGVGVAGVAWRVQIMACKCFDKFGVGSISACITCLEYARTNGASLVNASWGFNTNSLALSNALYSIRTAGMIVVAASGNNASNIDVSPSYPSSYHFDNIVSVAYTTREDTLATASNYGSTNVQLAAPGEQIYSTFAATDSYYYTLSGSSFAAPYVTGALALMLTKYPAEPYQQIISRLLNATDPLPSLAGKCVTGGRLNLRNALDPPVRLKPIPSGTPGLVQFRVVYAPNRACAIQSSTSLANWAPIYTNVTSAAGTFDFIDVLSTNFVPRFYRAVSSP